jgi:hypothetical protein
MEVLIPHSVRSNMRLQVELVELDPILIGAELLIPSFYMY